MIYKVIKFYKDHFMVESWLALEPVLFVLEEFKVSVTKYIKPYGNMKIRCQVQNMMDAMDVDIRQTLLRQS